MRISQLKEGGLYRDIVRGAWEMMWHRRSLWLLGFLAGLLMLNGGALEFIVRGAMKISGGAPFVGGFIKIQTVAAAIASGTFAERLALLLALVLAACLTILVVMISLAASGGLIYATARRVRGRDESLKESLAAGFSKFWPLFAIQAVGRMVLFTLFVFATLGLGAAYASASGIWIYDILFVIFAAAALVICFVMAMAAAGVVVNGRRVGPAVKEAFELLGRHWLISMEMIAVLFLAAVLAVAAAVALSAVLLVPFTLAAFALSALHAPDGVAVVDFLFRASACGVIVAVGGMLATFEHAAWTLLYLRLSKRGVVAKLERIYRAISKRIYARRRR